MPRDNKSKMTKKSSKYVREESRNKKYNADSSSDNDSTRSEEESEEELDVHEYRKLLKNIFPSKHLDKKVKAGDRLKNVVSKLQSAFDNDEEEEEEESESEEDYKKKLRSNKKKAKEVSKRGKKKSKKEDSDEEIELGSEDSEEEDEDEDEDIVPKTAGKFNIIFTIGGKNKGDEDDDDESYEDDEGEDEEWETCSEIDTENEDDPISSDSETEEDLEEESDLEEEEPKKRKSTKRVSSKKEKMSESNVIEKINAALTSKKENKTTELELINVLKELQSKNKDSDLVNECLRVCDEKIEVNKRKQEKKLEKEKARNGRIFKKILRDKNTMNDFEFYEKLETEHQKKIIKELREINKITRIEKPYRLTLLESDMPVIFKASAMKKISSLRYMENGSGEYYKIKNWVDTFMRIPFGTYKTLPITLEDGVDKCHDFMAGAQKTLDDAVYGLNDAKMQIMQMLGQLITNPKAIGSAIAIHGPPGTGKTSLVKEGISKILDRPFAFIALGGATDSSFLEGHGYTYEGSMWGKIVQILIDSKCMNPVIYFDELDKISDTPKGEEIAGILTHLTDTSQNSQFHDKYFAEVDFDLSKCLFIFSYNDESKVNSILKDRMYRIQTKGYNQKQKMAISNNYLLPRLREQVKFTSEDIIVPDQTLQYLIDNHCLKEDGVRNLKRCLEIIYTKLNLYRLMRPGSNLFEEDMSLKVEFPLTVTKDVVDKLIKKTDNFNPSLAYLYV
jgi:ATP-dependent Lon protease